MFVNTWKFNFPKFVLTLFYASVTNTETKNRKQISQFMQFCFNKHYILLQVLCTQNHIPLDELWTYSSTYEEVGDFQFKKNFLEISEFKIKDPQSCLTEAVDKFILQFLCFSLK